MKTLLWARWDERNDGTHALTFFRRIVIETPRGEALEDVPVLTVEADKAVKTIPEAVQLELDVTPATDGSIAVAARILSTDDRPQDPKIKLKNFDDPESERRKTARGMSRFLGKEEKSKPVSKGATPPAPPEQRVGGRGGARGRRKKGKGSKKIKRGGAVRGARRSSQKKRSEES
jgi:hypothetical protein